LLKYRLEERRPPTAPRQQTYYWFDPDSRMIAMMTTVRVIDGAPIETAIATIRLNVELDDGLFSLDPPPGYAKSQSAE
jgi:outer membrane lipoprotein-sorting protein